MNCACCSSFLCTVTLGRPCRQWSTSSRRTLQHQSSLCESFYFLFVCRYTIHAHTHYTHVCVHFSVPSWEICIADTDRHLCTGNFGGKLVWNLGHKQTFVCTLWVIPCVKYLSHKQTFCVHFNPYSPDVDFCRQPGTAPTSTKVDEQCKGGNYCLKLFCTWGMKGSFTPRNKERLFDVLARISAFERFLPRFRCFLWSDSICQSAKMADRSRERRSLSTNSVLLRLRLLPCQNDVFFLFVLKQKVRDLVQ